MGKIGGFRRDWFQEPFVIKTLTCLRWRKIWRAYSEERNEFSLVER
jgi:hypothetical protein